MSAVAAQTVVTMTATVQAAGAPVSPGQVSFCDATAKLCSDIHLVGTAQVLASGTATIKFTPGPGTHSYRAVFLGTNSAGPSVSAVLPLSVSGAVYGVTTTTISASGGSGGYGLASTVSAAGYAVAPTGTISFIDSSYGNSVLGAAPLGQGSAVGGLGFSLVYTAPDILRQNAFMVALGDFNGDGKEDAAVANGSLASTPVSVLLGNGDGTMTPAPPVAVPVQVGSMVIAIADVNVDGIPDIITSLYDPTVATGVPLNQLRVLLGKGDGTFSLGQVISVPDPSFIAVGDFNGDGIPDFALSVASSTPGAPGSIMVALGNGDGTFQVLPVTSPTGVGPDAIAVGDFNRDGKLDLAVSNASSSNITILFGNGDGTFTASSLTPATGYSPSAIVAADFNRDGLLDLATQDTSGGVSGIQGVHIFLGNGDGTFNPAPFISTSIMAGNGNLQLGAGDFNGDGIADLVFLSNDGTSSLRLAVALGDGSGTFAPIQFLTTCSLQFCGQPTVLAAGDFNGDGLSDIASNVQPTMGFGYSLTIDLAEQSIDSSTAQSGNITLPPGSGVHQVYASYPGDGTFPASVSGTVTLIAPPAATSVSLGATPQTTYFGQQVALTASVTPPVLFGNSPAGKVVFSLAGNPIGKGSPTSTAETFVLDTSTLPVGANSISAAYGGDSNFSASTSPAVVVNVQPADFALTVSPSLVSVVQGGSGTAAVTITALGAFTQPLQLSCSGLPIHATCAFSPATVTAGAAPVSSVLTVTTTSQHAGLGGTRSPATLALGLPVGLIGLFALCKGRRGRGKMLPRALLLLTGLGAAIAATGCGQDVFLIASPAGTSPLTVTATSAASMSVSHSVGITLTVTQ